MVRRNFRHLDIADFRLLYKTYHIWNSAFKPGLHILLKTLKFGKSPESSN